jgi:putative sterol carrier protein
MAHAFLSDEWFTAMDELVAKAGDLKIPAAMKAIEVNITIVTKSGDKQVYVKDGVLSRGHRPNAPTSLTLSEDLARKVFVEADTAAGIQAFLTGEIKAEGDLKNLVAMQMEEPSKEQQALAKQIAAITA